MAEVKEKKTKKKKKKMSKFELIFDLISIVFLVGFTIFYGYRMIHYKKIFTPKSSDGKKIVLLNNTIKAENDNGLVQEGRYYIFKGENAKNYIKFSNMLFRITKINSDGTMEMVLDDTLNYLAFDKEKYEFDTSNIDNYLNEYFYKKLNTSLLTTGTYCKDKVSDLNKITCENKGTSNVKLLSVSDYLNSKKDDKSYLNDSSIVWLNDNNGEQVWLLNKSNLSLSSPNELYEIKPVLTLNNVVGVYSGSGTKDDPYIIEEKNEYFASYVKLDNDIYRVTDINSDTLKLTMNSLYKDGNTKMQFSSSSNTFSLENGLGKYLNNTFLDEISYSSVLVECEHNVGMYNRYYENVLKNPVKAKVSIPSIIDPIFNKEDNNYYLTTPFEDKYVYIFNKDLYAVKPTALRNIKPVICIDKKSIKSGDGSLNNPYVVEVK